jgi:hypothetical protein
MRKKRAKVTIAQIREIHESGKGVPPTPQSQKELATKFKIPIEIISDIQSWETVVYSVIKISE